METSCHWHLQGALQILLVVFTSGRPVVANTLDRISQDCNNAPGFPLDSGFCATYIPIGRCSFPETANCKPAFGGGSLQGHGCCSDAWVRLKCKATCGLCGEGYKQRGLNGGIGCGAIEPAPEQAPRAYEDNNPIPPDVSMTANVESVPKLLDNKELQVPNSKLYRCKPKSHMLTKLTV